MIIRKALPSDAEALKTLYFEYLTAYPPKEAQNMDKWREKIEKMANSDNMYLLVAEEDGAAVSSVCMVIVDNLTHNLRPYAVIENVVTHGDYQKRGFASALLQKAISIAKDNDCYKVFLETGSNKESTLNFYRNNGFLLDKKHSCMIRFD